MTPKRPVRIECCDGGGRVLDRYYTGCWKDCSRGAVPSTCRRENLGAEGCRLEKYEAIGG